ncbi:MAG: class I SAM-dependent methyltransferase [Ignavibacteriales bacterium]|nr:class I SAM-dependent methyltransferase [Ignavibacteriales bacterium]
MKMTDTNDETLKQQVREYWDAHPCGTQFTHLEWGSKQFFDEVERFRYDSQPFMRELVEFDNFRGKRLLEIGCGLGTDLLQFARGGAITSGVDLTPASIELVKKRFALEGISVDAQVADAENLPFPDASFDVVYSFGVLHHTPNTQKSIDEVHRVLKPGGRIVIMLYHKNSVHVFLGAPIYSMLHKLRAGAGSLVEDWVRVYDGAENPLGKAYSEAELRTMFTRFKDLRFAACDPIRRKYGAAVNWLNQKFLSRRWGFWMVIKGRKAEDVRR